MEASMAALMRSHRRFGLFKTHEDFVGNESHATDAGALLPRRPALNVSFAQSGPWRWSGSDMTERHFLPNVLQIAGQLLCRLDFLSADLCAAGYRRPPDSRKLAYVGHRTDVQSASA